MVENEELRESSSRRRNYNDEEESASCNCRLRRDRQLQQRDHDGAVVGGAVGEALSCGNNGSCSDAANAGRRVVGSEKKSGSEAVNNNKGEEKKKKSDIQRQSESISLHIIFLQQHADCFLPSHGICDTCGGEIAIERLEALLARLEQPN